METVLGVVFLPCGGSAPRQKAQNSFTCPRDTLEHKRPLNHAQRPLGMMKWIVTL